MSENKIFSIFLCERNFRKVTINFEETPLTTFVQAFFSSFPLEHSSSVFYYPVLETGGGKEVQGFHQPPSHFQIYAIFD